MSRIVFRGKIVSAGHDKSGKRYAIYIPVPLRKRVEELGLVGVEVVIIVEKLEA